MDRLCKGCDERYHLHGAGRIQPGTTQITKTGSSYLLNTSYGGSHFPLTELFGGIPRVVRFDYKLAVVLTDLDNLVRGKGGCVPLQTSEGTPAPISLASPSWQRFTGPARAVLSDYTGGSNIDEATKYILGEFARANHAQLSALPPVRFTPLASIPLNSRADSLTGLTADTCSLDLVSEVVKEPILYNALKDHGIL